MKKEKPNTDFIFFVVCIISLICIAARIIFSIIQLNTAENADLIENAYCKVNSMDIDKQEQYALYGQWQYYPEQHIYSAPGIHSDKGFSYVNIPIQWNMFDKRFWNTSGWASYQLTLDIADHHDYVLYLHSMPIHFNIYVDGQPCPLINNQLSLFNRGIFISPGTHTIVIECSSNWLTGLYASPWLYTYSRFQKQTHFFTGIWEISIGGFIIAILYGIIFLRKSHESLFFKKQIINTGLFFIFYQLTFCEFSLDINLLSRFLPISKIHILTLLSAIALGTHTIKMFEDHLSNMILRNTLDVVVKLFFSLLVLKTFIGNYVNLQFIIDLFIMFIIGILIICILQERSPQAYGIIESLLSVLLIGTAIVCSTSANMHKFSSEVYFILPFTFMITLLCYGCFIASEFARIEKEAEHKQLLEQELLNAKMAYLTSQIQPHFQYNTLAMIQELCYSNPLKAADAIVKFSSVLRRRVDFNHYSQLEPFEKELSCITDYIDLQRMRFGDTLIFHSDIQYTQFDIPPLSIQTLIENAIYHGIRKKKSGGILTLKTYKENNIIYIIVSDNGIGFDLNVLHNSKGNGIHNSQARIVSLTGGSLNIASTPGTGTTVTIEIPQKRTF